MADFFDFTRRVQRRAFERVPDDIAAEEVAAGLLLRRVDGLLTADAEQEVLRPLGLSWASFRVCVSLWVDGPQRPNEVAQTAAMSRAGVSIAMKQLLAAGFIVTRPAEHDLRAIIMALTPEGEAAFERAYRRHLEITREWLAPLSIPERQQLVALLGKIMLAPRGESMGPRRARGS